MTADELRRELLTERFGRVPYVEAYMKPSKIPPGEVAPSVIARRRRVLVGALFPWERPGWHEGSAA